MTDPGKVVLAGDWHGDADWGKQVIDRAAHLLADEPNKVILHAGDFGVWPGSAGRRYLDAIDEALWEAGAQIRFVDGNHEWHPKLREWQASVGKDRPVWLSATMAWLPRGHRWTWHGKTWLALGGAVSVDKALRTEGTDWWPEEEISMVDVEKALTGGPVDAMLCHDAPSEVQLTLGPWPRGWDRADEMGADMHRQRLQHVVSALEPSLLIHGHYHQSIREFSQQSAMDVIGLDCDGSDDNFTVLDARTLKEL